MLEASGLRVLPFLKGISGLVGAQVSRLAGEALFQGLLPAQGLRASRGLQGLRKPSNL